MKIAIIGAGISGLSCAIELKRNGITPDLYEKKSRVGEPGFANLWLRAAPGIAIDQFAYIRLKYALDLSPLSCLKEITIKTAEKQLNINGKLGYIIKRGIEANSIDNQLYSEL